MKCNNCRKDVVGAKRYCAHCGAEVIEMENVITSDISEDSVSSNSDDGDVKIKKSSHFKQFAIFYLVIVVVNRLMGVLVYKTGLFSPGFEGFIGDLFVDLGMLIGALAFSGIVSLIIYIVQKFLLKRDVEIVNILLILSYVIFAFSTWGNITMHLGN